MYISFYGCTGVHQPLTWPQGRPKAPPRHAVVLLKPPPLFTHSPRLANIFSSTCLLLPCSKKDTKTTTKQQRKPPLSHSLSRALGRRWVLASLSRPALVSTSAIALTQQTEHEGEQGDPMCWRALTTPNSITSRPLFDNTYSSRRSFHLRPRLVHDVHVPQFSQYARPPT